MTALKILPCRFACSLFETKHWYITLYDKCQWKPNGTPHLIASTCWSKRLYLRPYKLHCKEIAKHLKSLQSSIWSGFVRIDSVNIFIFSLGWLVLVCKWVPAMTNSQTDTSNLDPPAMTNSQTDTSNLDPPNYNYRTCKGQSRHTWDA